MNNSDIISYFESSGFSIIEVRDVDEVGGTCFSVKHKASGLRLLYIKNNDVNKSFSISFKTPPVDNTGVFHILEHSVLCGSKKYPVKEPFVNLLKSSMQTFLNAMTFPDKTVYPVSSTNSHDLENLMRIYLDAVFNPRIFDEENIFKQEGWHKEVDEDGALTYNGVVYSEMKGALSDIEQMCYFELCKRILPGTCYAFESGGLPADIPNLTYENFLDTHRRHYSPQNSYVVLYGNLDVKYFTNIILNDFILPIVSGDISDVQPNGMGKIGEIDTSCSCTFMDIDTSAQTCACGFVVDETASSADIFSLNAIFTYLMASNDSPLKKKLLESGLAEDFYVQVIDSLKTPFIMLVAKGIKDSSVSDKILKLFVTTIDSIATAGIDKSGVMAAINNMIYYYREKNYGISDGVYYAIKALDSWLYDDDNSTEYLRYEDIFSAIEEKSANNYFNDLLINNIVNNRCSSNVAIMSDSGCKGSDRGSVLPKSEADKIRDELIKLKTFQETADSEDAINTLPVLTLSDVEDNKCKLKYDITKNGSATYIKHDLDINGIDYFDIYFDIKHLTFDDIPYVSLLCSLLTNFDTGMFTADKIPTFLLDTVGNLNFSIDITDHVFDEGFEAKLLVRLSCLSSKTDEAFSFLKSLIHTSDFSDIEKVKSLLMQTKLMLDQDIINSGHTFAIQRSASHLRPSFKIAEHAGGISFIQFLMQAISHIDDFAVQVSEKLSGLLTKAFSKNNIIFSHNVECNKAEKLLDELSLDNAQQGNNLQVDVSSAKNEGFIVNSNVSFSALRADLRAASSDFKPSSTWTIADRVLSYDYLWNNIRVKGGAYGCGFRSVTSGVLGFHTYRDPNVDTSYEIMKDASKYISTLNLSNKEFDGYIISSIGTFDAPIKARAAMRRADVLYLQGLDKSWLDDRRAELLQVTLDKVKALAPSFDDIWSNSSKCTIGNATLLENTNIFDEVIRL